MDLAEVDVNIELFKFDPSPAQWVTAEQRDGMSGPCSHRLYLLPSERASDGPRGYRPILRSYFGGAVEIGSWACRWMIILDTEVEGTMQKWVALCFASLVAVAVFASGVMRAQTILLERALRVVSGADVGFSIEGTDQSGKAVGRWMIRVDGKWVEASGAPVARRLSQP